MTDRGTRLSPDWEPSQELRDYAAGLGFEDLAINRIALDFVAYWSEIPGQRGRKLKWSGTWQVWCRREADKRWRGPYGARGNPPRSSILDIANELSLGLRERDA